MNDLRISLVQGATRWHDPAGNRDYYGDLMAPLHGTTDLVVLPETFTSGFTNEAIDQAEDMDGPTVAWMREQASQLDAAITGSVQIRGRAARAYSTACCSPRPMAGPRTTTSATCSVTRRNTSAMPRAATALTVEWKGWRICPLVCYDLRFPVYSRNRYDVERKDALDYDLLMYVANWPAARAYPWKTLLRARAIENLCFVAGRQSRRHRRQRTALFRRQRGDRFPRPSAERIHRRGSGHHHDAAGRGTARASRSASRRCWMGMRSRWRNRFEDALPGRLATFFTNTGVN